MSYNGVGPAWAWEWVRVILTKMSRLFFDDASWQEHDEGYSRGYPPQIVCDAWFLHFMWCDARRQTGLKRLLAFGLALIFHRMVRLFGWTAYNSK
jgi:hypothetical protein